jgi:hypothetical protein
LRDNISLSINALAKAFQFPRICVISALEHGLNPARHRGKRTALDQDREQQMLDWINQSSEGNTPVTKKEIKNHCTSLFQDTITRGWVNSFVLPDLDEIIQWICSPQEE